MNDAAYLFPNEDNPRFKDHLFTLTSFLPQDFRTFVDSCVDSTATEIPK